MGVSELCWERERVCSGCLRGWEGAPSSFFFSF